MRMPKAASNRAAKSPVQKKTRAAPRAIARGARRPVPSRKQLERILLVKELSASLREVPDPRMNRSKLHSVAGILGLVLVGTLAGANTVVGIQEYGRSRHKFLRRILDIPNGIPDHNTITRVLAVLDPQALLAALHAWVVAVRSSIRGPSRHIAIDGKANRGAVPRGATSSALHIVRAFAVDFGIVLGAVRTAAKSNEIKAIPELLAKLKLEGAMVTIDAAVVSDRDCSCNRRTRRRLPACAQRQPAAAARRRNRALHWARV